MTSIRSVSCLAMALVVLGLSTAGCGSGSSTKPSPAVATAPSSTPTSIVGRYVAHLTTNGLSAAGVDYVNVGGGGVWHLTVTDRRLSLQPPPPASDGTQ